MPRQSGEVVRAGAEAVFELGDAFEDRAVAVLDEPVAEEQQGDVRVELDVDGGVAAAGEGAERQAGFGGDLADVPSRRSIGGGWPARTRRSRPVGRCSVA